MGIDVSSDSIIKTEVYSPYSTNLLNLELGILVAGFKASYRMTNVLNNNINNSINDKAQVIMPLNHIEVVWEFKN